MNLNKTFILFAIVAILSCITAKQVSDPEPVIVNQRIITLDVNTKEIVNEIIVLILININSSN